MKTQAACFLGRDCSAEVVGDMFILNLWVKCVSVCVFIWRTFCYKQCNTAQGQCVTLV